MLRKYKRRTCLNTYPLKSESEVTQSCSTLPDLMDCSLPGFSVHWIFQARVLEWIAISFSRGSSWPRDRTQVSCIAGRRFTLWATLKSELKEKKSESDHGFHLPVTLPRLHLRTKANILTCSYKKEWSTDSHLNMGEPWKHCAKWKRSDTKAIYCMIAFIWNFKNKQTLETHAKSRFTGKDWCWERLRAGERGDKGWKGWMVSPSQWTWVQQTPGDS